MEGRGKEGENESQQAQEKRSKQGTETQSVAVNSADFLNFTTRGFSSLQSKKALTRQREGKVEEGMMIASRFAHNI